MQQLEPVLQEIGKKYDVATTTLTIAGKPLKILEMKDFEGYVDKLVESTEVGLMNFPYWAKIWEASILLSYFLGKQPVALGQRILEIGAGMGVVGVYAALCGHKVTISDNNDDALLFAQANVILNGATQAEVRKIDWNRPEDLDGTYDMIVGAEVVYDRENYPLLVSFLRRALAPDGMIFLAKHTSLHTPLFFAELTRFFEFKQMTQTIRSGDREEEIALFAIRRKQGVRP